MPRDSYIEQKCVTAHPQFQTIRKECRWKRMPDLFYSIRTETYPRNLPRNLSTGYHCHKCNWKRNWFTNNASCVVDGMTSKAVILLPILERTSFEQENVFMRKQKKKKDLSLEEGRINGTFNVQTRQFLINLRIFFYFLFLFSSRFVKIFGYFSVIVSMLMMKQKKNFQLKIFS